MSDSESKDPQFVRALRVGDLYDGAGRTVEVAGRWLAVFAIAGEYFAIDNACPHMSGPLGAGTIEDYAVTCPLHHWQIDVRTGTSPTNEYVRVSRFETRVEDGWVLVEL